MTCPTKNNDQITAEQCRQRRQRDLCTDAICRLQHDNDDAWDLINQPYELREEQQ